MSDKLINDLKESIASSNRKPLIICGAGVSVSATEADAPSWAELLESGIAKVESLNPDEGDWAIYARSRLQKNKASEWIKVADEITELLGGQRNAEFMEWIEERVGHLQIKSSELLNAIKGLGCPVATTNYDDILAFGLGVPPITWDDPEQVHRFLLDDLDGVLHLHGHWRKPRTVILGSASYDMLNGDRKKEILSEFAALQSPAIYIGCSADGLSDPDFTHLAAFVTEWQQTMPRSYWLVKSDQRAQAKDLLSTENPRLFPIAFGTKHEELPAFLLSLAAKGVKTNAITTQFTSIEQQEPRPEIFGRDRELQDLEDALINGRSAAIGGGPGFGKTALAVATLYRPKIVEKFRDRRVFVSLEAEQEPTAMLAGLTSALGLPQGGDEASILRQIQLVAADAPFIAILDNAEHVIEANRGEAERILRLTAQIKGFSVLITTRGMVPQLPDAMIIQDLAKLDREAAKEAFLGIAGHQFDQDTDLASLLETLDGHALSIEIVAARAAASSNLAGINEAWQEMKAAILRRVGEEENRLTSVRASLALSLEAKLLVQNPFAKRLLSVLATLPAGLSRDAAPRILAERGGFSKEKAVDAILVLQQLKLVERRFDNRLRMLTPLRESARLDLSIFYPDKKRLIEYYFKIIESSDKIGTADWKSVSHDVEMESGNFDSIIRMASEDKNLLEKSYPSLIAVSEYFRFTGQGSIELLEYSSKFYNAIDNTRKLGTIYSVIAAVYLTRQEFTKAKNYYHSGLNLATTAKSSLTKANCYAGLGEIEDILGNAEQAEYYLKKAIEEYKNTSDLTGRANQIKYLSDIKRGKGDPNFIDLLKEAHDLYVESGDLLGVTNTKRDISEYNKEDLETVLRDAIASYHNLGASMSEADTRTRLAYQLQAANRNPEAISELDEACKLARMGANSRVEAIAIIVRGVVLRRILDNSWQETMSDGFDLLRKNLAPNAVVHAGYNALENYLIAPDERSRGTARELTYQAWKDVGKLDHARVWLETPIC